MIEDIFKGIIQDIPEVEYLHGLKASGSSGEAINTMLVTCQDAGFKMKDIVFSQKKEFKILLEFEARKES